VQIVPQRPEADRRKPHHRANGQVDAAGDQHRRHRDGQQAEFHAQPRDFEEVADGEKVRGDK
jgi:hypothetical protein